MIKDGKKIEPTVFLTLSGGGRAEALYLCNAQEAVQRDGHLFSPLPFTVYLHMRFSPFPAFRIIDNEDLIHRFNRSVITAMIELTMDQVSYVICATGARFEQYLHLRVSEGEPSVDLSPLY